MLKALNISPKGGLGRISPAGWSGPVGAGVVQSRGRWSGLAPRALFVRGRGATRGTAIPPERAPGVQSRQGTIQPPAQRGEAGPPRVFRGGAAERLFGGDSEGSVSCGTSGGRFLFPADGATKAEELGIQRIKRSRKRNWAR